jgi:cell division septation protein DedD
LGLSADQRGELREARGHFDRLVREYPSSPRIEEAQGWIRSHQEEVDALPEEAPPAELVRPEVRVPLEEARAAEGRTTGEFAVQLGAFRSLERALSLAEEVREAGQDPRVVRTPGNELAKVRVGRFPSREAAVELAGLLEGLGFEVTLATDAGAEERIGTGG